MKVQPYTCMRMFSKQFITHKLITQAAYYILSLEYFVVFLFFFYLHFFSILHLAHVLLLFIHHRHFVHLSWINQHAKANGQNTESPRELSVSAFGVFGYGLFHWTGTQEGIPSWEFPP